MTVNQQKKRILIFSTAYMPEIGGAEIAVKEITDRLSDRFEFVLFTARLKKELLPVEKIGNIEVHRIGKGNAWDKFRLVKEGHKKAKEFGPFDAVWSIMASYGGFAALRFKKKNKEVPFLLTLQEGDSRARIYSRVWWCWSYFTQIFKRANYIQAVSNYLATWAKELGATCPVEVVPNGFNANIFNIIPTQSAKINIRKEFGINHAGPLILTVSRLMKKNGIDILIRSLSFLPAEFHLAIAGDGTQGDQLKKLAKATHVSARVHFLGLVPHERLPYLYASSSIFCRPSRSEGLGNVFLEAFASRIPVIATNVGGIGDVVKDNETGLVVRPEDPKDVAEKIIKLVHDEPLQATLTENAYKFSHVEFNWDMIADRMGQILEKI